MYLYWVTTEDHAEDWFIISNSAEEAPKFHETVEGYEWGDATAGMILEIPEGITVDVGWPSEEALQACGTNIIADGFSRESGVKFGFLTIVPNPQNPTPTSYVKPKDQLHKA